ncbi:uncharacterized protein LOC5573676 isoform X2 [Aedes aegypti]|uniref:Odorant receptor n=1 Tax=Aedes aegypti TaxID=7159 RepID=A0A6I8TJG1_AEDAE
MESSLTTYTMEIEYYRPNSNSAEDNDASIYWLRVLSASLGIWPQKLVGDKKQWWKRLYYFMIIMHWYNTYLQVEFFFHNLGALKTMTEGLCSFCSISLTGIKIMRLNSFSNEINLLLERMRTHHFMQEIKLLKKGKNKPIFERIDQIMKDKWKEVKINLLLYTVSVGIVASSYSIFPAVINLINLFQGSSNPRRFVYKTYYRGMENLKFYSPLHEILFSSESLSGYTTFAGVIAFDGLYVLLTMHVITIFKSLKLVIKESTRSIFTDEEKQFYLHECIDHYTRAIMFMDDINKIFSPIFILQLFTSTSIICVIAFHASANALEKFLFQKVISIYLHSAEKSSQTVFSFPRIWCNKSTYALLRIAAPSQL